MVLEQVGDAAQVDWGLFQFFVAVPAGLIALAYFLPGARLRRKIKSDSDVVTALPRSELRDRFQERINANAQRLLRHEVYIAGGTGYWLEWAIAILWVGATAALISDFPRTVVAVWESEGGVFSALLLVIYVSLGLGVVSLLRGGDIHGFTPDARRDEMQDIADAVEKWHRRRERGPGPLGRLVRSVRSWLTRRSPPR